MDEFVKQFIAQMARAHRLLARLLHEPIEEDSMKVGDKVVVVESRSQSGLETRKVG